MNACIRGAAHSVGGVRGPFGGPARTPALTPYHTRNINHIRLAGNILVRGEEIYRIFSQKIGRAHV